jgi:hypothetical protein
MSEPLAASELDDQLFDAIRNELRKHVQDATEIALASTTTDIVRAIAHAGFEIHKC